MKKLIILFLLLPSLLFSQVSPSKIERIADANTVFGTALSYGTYLVVQSNNKTYKIISVNGVAGTAKLSDLVLNTDYIEEGSVTSVSTAAANNGVTATWSMASPTPALTIGLGAITPTSVNGLTLTALATGFTVAGGTTSKTLTVPLDASVSGTNTGDQTTITGNAGNVTGIVAPANGGTGIANNAAMTVTGAGNFAYTRTLTAATNVTFPTSGTLTTLAGTEALTNKDLTSGNTFPTFNQNTSGNAATVTTNANLTGPVTSTGNATAIANGAISNAMLANGAVANLSGTNTGDQTTITGNAGTVTTNANLTGEVTSIGNAATLGSFTSLSLKTALTDETGSGAAVFATSPTFITPILGTPTSGIATNLTGTAAGLTAGNVTTNADLTGPITSVGNATSIASQTGTGTTFVMNTSPTLVTPVLGVATATSINGNTITTGTGTLTLAAGKTLTATNTLTLTGTDGSSVAFGTGGTVAYTENNLSVFAATISAELAGVLSDETGSGAAVFGTSPVLSTPEINGTITGTTVIPVVNGGTGQSSYTNGQLLIGNTTGNTLNKGTLTGTAGQITVTNGAGAITLSTSRTLIELGADVNCTATTNFQDITGLSFPMTSGVKYRFYAVIWYIPSATTRGVRISCNSATPPTSLTYTTRVPISATAGTDQIYTNSQVAYDSGTNSGASASTTGNIAIIEGFITAAATEIFILRFAPEAATADQIIIKSGSTLEVW
ncbi:MAG: hypothetical protein V4549_00815 [Bacteroidota bacterium]